MKRRSWLQVAPLVALPTIAFAKPINTIKKSVLYRGPREPDPNDPPTDTNLKKVFDEVRTFVAENPGSVVYSADEPLKGYIGWLVTTPSGTERSWTIWLGSLRQSEGGMDGLSKAQQDTVRRLLKTTESRVTLARMLARA